MSTKSMPGAFNCYAAALPDEPVFTILGRDPAFPATVSYWRDQRVALGKNETEDDIGRLAAVSNEIAQAIDWRYKNLDPFGDGVPTWKLPRQFETDEPPLRLDVRVPTILNHDEVMTDLRALVDMMTDGNFYKDYDESSRLLGTLRSLVDSMKVQPETNTLNYDADLKFNPEGFLADVVVKGERQLVRIGPKNMTIKEIEKRLFNADKIAISLRQVGEDLNKACHERPWPHKVLDVFMEFVDRINDHAVELGAYVPGNRVKGNRALGMGYQLGTIGAGDPYKMVAESINEWKEDLTPGERVQVDTAPEDLAHAPEVPQHRFSQFNKGVNFAYSRGLEINPSHLPIALDAMLLDGWDCICSFGQTDSQHIGFLFKRVMPEPVIVNFDSGLDPEWESRLEEYMTKSPRFTHVNPQNTFRATVVDDEADRYRKGAIVDVEPMRKGLESVRDLVERYKDQKQSGTAYTAPKIEVHIDLAGNKDAIEIMSIIECRLRCIPNNYQQIRIVGLIADQPEAAFDFTQHRGRIEKRKTLIKGDCGDMEFGRQQEP